MPSINYYIDGSGTIYKELSDDKILNLQTNEILLKFTITTLEPVAGNPIGLLLSLTYA